MDNIFQQAQSSTDRFKAQILTTLEKTLNADMEGDRERYSKGVKSLVRLCKGYMTEEKLAIIEGIFTELSKALEKIDSEKEANETSREQKRIKARYEFFDKIALHVFDVILSSSIIEKDVEGLIIHDSTIQSLTEYSKEIKSGPVEVTRVESGEFEEGSTA